MKLQFDIDGQKFPAEVVNGNGTAQITLGGKTHRAIISEPEPGIFIVLINNRVYRCMISITNEGRSEINVNDELIPVTVYDPKRFTAESGSNLAQGRASLTAPMPGKVVRIMLKAGDAVAAHQGIMVVEAMKMQNEVIAPKDGTITEIRVSEGQTVNAGEVLAVID